MSGGKGGSKTIHTEKTSIAEPIAYYKSQTGVYPNNAEIWWSYRRPLEIGSDKPPKNYLEVFDPSLRFQVSLGNSPAPKGHYILKAFQQDRSSVSGVQGLEVKSAYGFRPSAVAFYTGRAWYAGVNTAGYNTKIYFTQIIERDEQLQECYQTEDPTAESLHDLLPTDGGVVVIPELTEVYNLVPLGNSLFVFAKNGVWEISGSIAGYGFKADDYAVHKISGVSCLSNMSFVLVEGVPFWWNRTGIYTLQNQNNQYNVASLTDDTIKTYFSNIPSSSKFYAKGAYDSILRRIQWLYRTEDVDVPQDNYVYDTILNFDLRTGAFYEYKTADTSRIKIIGIFDIQGLATSEEDYEVYVNDDQVLVGTDEVHTKIAETSPVDAKFKYIVNVVEEDVSDLPVPPPGPTPRTFDVYVNDDPVQVGSDLVQYTEIV